MASKCLFIEGENSHMDPKGIDSMGAMLVKSLSEIEELAEEIMADKEQVYTTTKCLNLLVIMGNNDL